MPRQSVKGMSRRQQKAVFAKLGNPGSDERTTKSQRSKILKREFPNADFDKDGVKNAEDCKPLDKNRQDKILKSHIKFDKFSKKYKVKPSGKNYRWSENIVVNPTAPKEQRILKGEWVREPGFIEKRIPSVFSIRFRSKEGKRRDELEKLVNEKGLEEGYKSFKN